MNENDIIWSVWWELHLSHSQIIRINLKIIQIQYTVIIGCQVQLQFRLIKKKVIIIIIMAIVFMLSAVNMNIVLSHIHFTIFKSIPQIAQAYRKEQHILSGYINLSNYTVSDICIKNVWHYRPEMDFTAKLGECGHKRLFEKVITSHSFCTQHMHRTQSKCRTVFAEMLLTRQKSPSSCLLFKISGHARNKADKGWSGLS